MTLRDTLARARSIVCIAAVALCCGCGAGDGVAAVDDLSRLDSDAAIAVDLGIADLAAADLAAPDAATADLATVEEAPDAAVTDAAMTDAAVTDAAVTDAAVTDAAAPDAAMPDAGPRDAGPVDWGADAGPCPPEFTPKTRAAIGAALDALVCNELRRDGVPGAVAAQASGGAVKWKGHYGYADTFTHAPVTDASVFQVASISKSLTAWGAMTLVEAGKLNLDAPIDMYLTRWHLPASAFTAAKVTARRLMSHTAGTNLHGYVGFPPNSQLPTIEQSLDGMNNGAGPVKLIQEPGTGYMYSGGGITLLQLAIEEISGQKFETYMKAAVLAPLGMNSSAFEWEQGLRPLTPKAYDINGAELPNYIFTEKAAAGLYTTAADLALYTAALMPGPNGEPIGRGVLKPASVTILQTVVPGGPWNTGDPSQPGLGCFTQKINNGDVLLHHNGSNLGWKASYYVDITQKESVVLLTNGDTGTKALNTVVNTWAGWLLLKLP